MTIDQLHDLPKDSHSENKIECMEDSIISFEAQLPLPLKESMQKFIAAYPNWDQYRLIQAALAGFLVQNGFNSRAITRLYIGNMFAINSLNSND